MREIRLSGSMSGRWKRGKACRAEPRRGNPDTRKYVCLNHRATSRLYWCQVGPRRVLLAFLAAKAGELQPDSRWQGWACFLARVENGKGGTNGLVGV